MSGRDKAGFPSRRPLRYLLALALLIAILALGSTGYIEKWLWMRELGYSHIFWTLFAVKWAMFFCGFITAFLFLWINLHRVVANCGASRTDARATRFWLGPDQFATSEIDFSLKLLNLIFFGLSVFVALLFAASLYAEWDTYLRFRYGGSFGIPDPIFGVDVGFYIFRLPFYGAVQSTVMLLAGLTLVCVFIAYMFFGQLLEDKTQSVAFDRGAAHLSILLLFLVADLGWGFYLGRYQLLYSRLGVVHGVGFTVDHVTRYALWFMIGASVLACAMLATNFFRRRVTPLAVGAAAYFGLWVIAIGLLPSLVQNFIVAPNELALETPYLKNFIAFTRSAFQLDRIVEKHYPALEDLTHDAVSRNEDTIKNIRLWDTRPLLQTYEQTQAIRLYYQFYNVATDRYHLPDGYHQVMLSARELSPELPAKAQTWVNQYLEFTHGYGVAMNFVSKTVGGGFPDYLLQNVPAESAFGLKIEQPSIYFGRSMPGAYRIVATRIREFDYPKGNDNVYTSYAGKGGVPLDSIWKRLLFAWNKADVNILLTSYLTPESRIQLHRDVRERVSQIAPFLRLDSDPYPVLSDGKLYWIQDAYTASNYFPYANPQPAAYVANSLSQSSDFRNLNYIRNSVKVIVDMYEGTVSFYVMDAKDPVLAVYQQAFPHVFKELSELPPDLKKHLRYPEDLFAIQANQYKTFHMTDPQVFYNREDLWASPIEKYAGETQPMAPYYILMKVPGSDELEYLLITPFTPHNRDNMISWLAARSDFPDYGRLLLYQLPKEKLVYGPNQIEAMIDQNPEISQQLTLWNQNGSRVIRGKQIVTPIENSFLYVVPLYLTAAGTNLPQLKRVIAVAADKVVMEPSLDEALDRLFGGNQSQPVAMQGRPPEKLPTAQQSNLPHSDFNSARLQYQNAETGMKQGDWEKFGKAMAALKRLLANPKVTKNIGYNLQH